MKTRNQSNQCMPANWIKTLGLYVFCLATFGCGSQKSSDHRNGQLHYIGANAGTSKTTANGSATATMCEAAVLDQFKKTTWKNAFATCSGCHAAGGIYSASGKSLFVFPDGVGSTGDFLAVFPVAQSDINGQPLLLAKAQGLESHGGGKVFASTNDGFAQLSSFVIASRQAQVCIETSGAKGFPVANSGGNFDAGLTLLSPSATLNKAAVQLMGRYASTAELALVSSDIDSIDPVVTTMMSDPKFYDQAMNWFNDYWLVSAVGYQHGGLNLLHSMVPSGSSGGNEFFTYPVTNPLTGVSDYFDNYSLLATDAVAQEPLHMVAHILETNRPFTEILTAKYRMVNRPLAKLLKINEGTLGFKLPAADTSEWVEAQSPLVNVQYAGVLTTQSFMGRYANTGTNRYRGMAKNVLKLFQNFDVMAISSRVDLSSVNMAAYPWHTAPSCTGCHRYVDPVAGWFAMQSNCSVNFQPVYFRGPYGDWHDGCHTAGDPVYNGWFNSTDMFSPATSPASLDPNVPSTGVIAPADYPHALEIGAATLVKNDGFAVAITTQVFTKLTRYKDPTTNPEFTDPEVLSQANASYKATIRALADTFIQSKFNLRTLILAILKTSYFRAQDAVVTNPVYAGMGPKFLPPEVISTKIKAIFGLPWSDRGSVRLDDASTGYAYSLYGNFLDQEGFKVFAGGIDADNITSRLENPGAVALSVYKRMAYQMSCFRVAADFANSNRSSRLLFPFIDGTADLGAASNKAAVMQNVQYLYARILGQSLPATDPEIVAAYGLLMDLYTSGQAGIKAGTIPADMSFHCDNEWDYVTNQPTTGTNFSHDSTYTVRSWQGLTAYLLRSYQFMYMPN